MKTITVNLVPKQNLYPRYGKAVKPATVYVRDDLPKWVQISTMVHEIYHLYDDNPKRREPRAIMAQFFISLLGGIASVFMTLTDIDRIKFYMEKLNGRYKNK
jgi:hypothetical protein